MTKRKSKAVIMAADGTGGMTPIQDRRFESGDWPISFDVPREQADTWMQYLSAECQRRGWSCSNFTQIEARENSGSISVNTTASATPLMDIVWERKRGGPMKVRARLAQKSEIQLADAQGLIQRANELCRSGAKERIYCFGQLQYEGLPWRGELWLDDTLRLGPPARQDETALLGPRIILIDAHIDGIDAMDALSAFRVKLRELSVFLSVVMGREVRVPSDSHRAWTCAVGPTGQLECDVRILGYRETEHRSEMPARGQAKPVAMLPVQRPDFALRGLRPGDTEETLPADILDLWQAFVGLALDKRQGFLQAGSMWQLGLSTWREYPTAGYTWMVVACEVLKPPHPEFRDHNIYDVVEALLGKPCADLLKENWFRPQEVRSAHLHRGELHGTEFVRRIMLSSYEDPTFDDARRVLAMITPATIIEWLRRGGTFAMLPLKRRNTWRRWIKDHALALIPIMTAVGVIVGMLLGWLL